MFSLWNSFIFILDWSGKITDISGDVQPKSLICESISVYIKLLGYYYRMDNVQE